MNQLEKEIYKAFPLSTAVNAAEHSKVAAAISLKWIEKALSDAFNQAHYSQLHPDVVKRMEYNEWALNWLKENGLKTPEVSNTKENP